MNYIVILSTETSQDINKATDYIIHNLHNSSAAHSFNKLVIATANNLSFLPERHPIIDDDFLQLHQIRYVPIKNYLLFYQIQESTKTIYIVRFLYAKSNWYKILQDTLNSYTYPENDTTYYIHEEQEAYGNLIKRSVTMNNANNVSQHSNPDAELVAARQELYSELQKGLDSIEAGKTIPAKEVFAMLDKKFERYGLKKE